MGLLPENKPVQRSFTDNMRIILFGAPFCGKTVFASSFPDPIMINTDGNIKGITTPAIELKRKGSGCASVEEAHSQAWLLFKQIVPELLATDQYKTIVLDLISELYDMCRSYHLDTLGVRTEQDMQDHGRTYVLIREDFTNTMKPLLHSNKNVVMICHTKAIKDKNGTTLKITSDLPEKIFLGLAKSTGAHLFMSFNKDEFGNITTDENGNRQRILHMMSEETSSANRWGISHPIWATYDDLKMWINETNKK